MQQASKGQLISKGVLISSIFSKKRMKEFDFTTMIPQIDLFSFVFLEEIEDTKKPFRNYLTFTRLYRGVSPHIGLESFDLLLKYKINPCFQIQNQQLFYQIFKISNVLKWNSTCSCHSRLLPHCAGVCHCTLRPENWI